MDQIRKRVVRYRPGLKVGLTSQEVHDRMRMGLVNYDSDVPTKTVKQIVSGNIITLFNIINLGLAMAVILVGSFKNLLFMGIVLCNTAISIFQELRSKRIIDDLSVLSATKVKVIRNHKQREILIDQIVLDDILVLEMGNQVVVDTIIREGYCEVNESFITGESKPVYKKQGDMLLSGSFIVSGTCIGQVEHVGLDNYTSVISKDAKYIKPVNSVIMNSLNKIIKFVSIVLIPLGIILFFRQLHIDDNTIQNATINTVAAMIGMIPEGLVLLTSTVLAISVIRLAKHQVLVQELYCIETLARVDMLCLDKTGTITEGKMELFDVIPIGRHSKEKIDQILRALSATLNDYNPTFAAIHQRYGTISNWKANQLFPFSSARKFSGALFEKEGLYLMGAPEILLQGDTSTVKILLDQYTEEFRVLLLAKMQSNEIEKDKLPTATPVALILIQDKIRPQAKDTIAYFQQQGVTIKIISGDNPMTVKTIAERVGIPLTSDQIIDMTTLSSSVDLYDAAEKYTIFGRTSPTQKKELILALKQHGHTVAMTGDGVNDVLALKESDCAIAMKEGSDAARNVAQLVLLESNFDAMPKVVKEGRRTINNIQRSATLFLSKTIYSWLLALLFIFIEMRYPFMPIQLSLISSMTIGIPAFILALEPNHDRVEGNFFKNVVSKALPSGLTTFINVILVVILTELFGLSDVEMSTLAVILTAYIGFLLIYKISFPFNTLRKILLILITAIFIIQTLFFHQFFSLSVFRFLMILLVTLLVMINTMLFTFFSSLVDRYYEYHQG